MTLRHLLPIVALLAALVPISARAETACLVIAEAASGEVLHHEGDGCDEIIGPASTFKLTLAVIGLTPASSPTPTIRRGRTRRAIRRPAPPTGRR